MKTDPRVDDYIARAAPFARPILLHLRKLVHATIPDGEEAIKWGMPHFTYKGKNVAGMAAFKAHASLGIHGETRTPEGFGQFGKLKSLGDLPDEAEMVARLEAAMRRIEATGTALRANARPRTVRAELPIPPEFALALEANPAAKATLAAFAPSHRREYVEWIVEAKRPETRERRIAQSIAQLAEGKKRHWRYDRC